MLALKYVFVINAAILCFAVSLSFLAGIVLNLILNFVSLLCFIRVSTFAIACQFCITQLDLYLII